MAKWFSSRTVFSMLLLNTIISSGILVFVLVFSLQRIADEHPRRYLSKVLFANLVMDKTPEQLAQIAINGVSLIVVPQDKIEDPKYASYAQLFKIALNDPDGIAIITNNDSYMASAYIKNNHSFVILPLFGRTLSSQAFGIIGMIIVVIVLILLANFYSIHLLTKPFIELRRGVKHADDGDLNYRIPLNRTYGEYRLLAESFNSMLQQLHHIHEARRHMLLAIPHELRTPLTRLKVRKDLVTDEPLRLAILDDINNIERILDAILYTEKTQSGTGELRLSKIELRDFFYALIIEHQNNTHNIELNIICKQPFFYGHPEMLTVLMRNLISNALFYGQSQPVTVTIDEQNEALLITVTDQGMGIAADQLPFLTEPFWRADKSRQRESGGYGLGLYICKTILDGLGGEIKINSIEGQGTTVQVIFPHAFISMT
ncbi:HAMP domain-containing sensor histidine kinase [Orbaceae bacterium ESL0727]|nr:HAMP domain-containing sensor histidine kinase [Orbaceae bacterium ESL0727]